MIRLPSRIFVVLLVVCPVVLSLRADSVGQMWVEMRRRGFEQVSLTGEYLPLLHNSADAINDELTSEALRRRIGTEIGVELSRVRRSEYRISLIEPKFDGLLQDYPEEHLRFIAQSTRRFLWAKSDGVEDEILEKISAKVAIYAEARVAGHTKEYASDSMAEAPRPNSDSATTLRQRVLNEFPKLPGKWLRDTTNTYASVWYRPPKGTDPGVIPPPDQHEPVPLEYHVFRLMDGPVTWEYHVAENSPQIEVNKHDSGEDDPQKSKVIREARKEVDDLMKLQGIKGKFGSVHTYWRELKKVLKEKHSIDWLSPKELHPTRQYD